VGKRFAYFWLNYGLIPKLILLCERIEESEGKLGRIFLGVAVKEAGQVLAGQQRKQISSRMHGQWYLERE